MAIGKKIKSRREQLEWTQEELAKRMGYKSKSTINKIELGINDVVQSKIVQFSEVLGVSIAYLMGWDDEKISEIEESRKESFEGYIDESEYNRFQAINKLGLTDAEFDELINYAKYMISKRG